MSGIPVMDASTGAAWRFQLDGMLGALTPVMGRAVREGDELVTDLHAYLQEARDLAAKIEERQAAGTTYRGVRLTKG